MSPRLASFLKILASNAAIAAGLAALVYLLSGQVTWVLLAEVFVYANCIAFPAHAIMPRLFPCVAERNAFLQWTVFVAALTVISSAGAVAGSLAVWWLNLQPGLTFTEILSGSFTVCVFLTLLVGVIQASFERLRDQLENTKLRLRVQELERERAEKLASEARLAALEARLHPHFLFNTLNSISSLIPAAPERAERLIERMAALLRFTLEAPNSGLVGLDQELKIVRDYLDIEQARLGARLRYQVDAERELEGLRVPPLAVQTLVENSIKHAIAPNRQGGEIRVQVARQNGCLHVDVSDTGEGFSLESLPAGHGLDNLRHRLEALFGEAAELSGRRNGAWSTVSLKVPA